ncbi:MAG: tol-pal system protein YbgF [Nitrospirae bacterium]|nr:tol-pal system protein YbgF [Nitrospirota bacterium]
MSQKFKFTVYCLLFTVYCSLSACVTTENFDLLRQDVTQLQKESLLLKNELNNLKEKTSGAVREESFNAIRQSQAEIQSQLSNVSRDIQVLSGRFDENKYFMEKALKDSATERDLIKAQIMSIEGQIKDIREKLNALESQTGQQKEPPKEQPKEAEKRVEEPEKEQQQQGVQPPKATELADKTKAYEAAYNTFKEKQYKEARMKFEAFIKEFPKDNLTDNAQFWIAETYYGEKDFEGAILAYETLLKKYPNSEKAPGALLKQGFSFIEIGDRKTGKVILEKLRERHPDSKEAELAKKKIEEIEKKTGKRKK